MINAADYFSDPNNPTCADPKQIPVLMLIGICSQITPFAWLLMRKIAPRFYKPEKHLIMDKLNSQFPQLGHLLSFALLFNQKRQSKSPTHTRLLTEKEQALDERAKLIQQLEYRMTRLLEAQDRYERELTEKQQEVKESRLLSHANPNVFLTSRSSQRSTAFLKPDNPDDPNYLVQLEAHIYELEEMYKIRKH